MQDTSTPLPGTFQSIVPVVDEILAVLVNHANSDRAVSNVEASDAVAVKARELHNMMEGMKRAAMDLPGGHLRTDQLERLSEVLDIEAAKRERLLARLKETSCPVADASSSGDPEV